MRIPKEENWKIRGYNTREEWCKNRNEEYFLKKYKICSQCGQKFLGNRKYCSMKCTLIERTKLRDNGCLEWQGCTDSHGYGLIKDFENSKRNIRTHRLSYQIYIGEIPKGHLICHHCDNPKCCEPSHLFLGTYSDNMNDAAKKGRLHKVGEKNFGEKASRAKLTEKQVREIKKLLLEGKKDTWLSKEFCVHIQTIVAIRRGFNWKHL